jgi:integrase
VEVLGREWGLYVWLSAVLGARRGEVVALQWEDIDFDAGVVRLDENYVRTAEGMLLKDTKSHQMRRVSENDKHSGSKWGQLRLAHSSVYR